MESPAEPPEPVPSASPSPSPPTSPTTPDEVKFKSMLQVLLKTKQEEELSKNIEYKEKREEEGEGEEEEGRKKEKKREMEEQGEGRGVKGKENKKRDQGEDGRNNEREKEESSKNAVNEKGENKKKNDKPSKDEEETSESKKKKETKMKEKHKEEVNRDKEVKKSKETGTKEENKNKENREKEELETKEKKDKEENEKKQKRPRESNNKKEEGERKSKKEDIESKAKELTKNKKDQSKETKEELKEKDKAKKKEEKTKEKDTKKKEEEKTKEKKEEKAKEKKSEEKPKDTKENEAKTKETKENQEKTKEKRKEDKPTEKREVNLPKIEVDEVTSGQRSDAADQGRPPSTSSSSTSSPARSTLTPHPSSSSTKAKGNEGGRAEGILHKKGKGPFGSWKRYYFVLKGQLLMYYYSEHDYKELAGFKGSLDLTMLEEVSEKKRGFLKSHFPFALGRRNLKHIVLAAETSEERDHWMSVLRSSLLRPTGGSGNRSDSNLPAPRSGDTSQEKSATLPARSKTSPATSSLSESEDEAKQDEAKEDEAKQEEEEPKLIQPKKVQRIPVNPLGPIRIDAVKLRKVDRRPSDGKKDRDKAEGEDPPKELDPEATFGVKLKKHLSPRGDVGEAKEAKETSLTPSPKRPNKNPIIPLGKSPLLSRPEGELLKTSSPETQRRGGTPERKKSPSPSIPLSRGVHSVLAKSGEEGDEEREGKGAEEAVKEGVDAREKESREKNPSTKANRSPPSSSSSESEEEKEKDKEEDKPKETERRPSKDMEEEDKAKREDTPKVPDPEGEGEKGKAQERTPEDSERAGGSASPEAKEDSPSSFSSVSRDQDLSSQGSLSRQGSEAEFLQVSVTLKESAGDESEYDQLDEDVLRSVKPSGTPDGERKASQASPKPPSPHHTPSTSETSSPASIRALNENEKPRLAKPNGGSAGATPPRSPFRRRSNTNDSSGSCKSEPDSPEKKSGKFMAIFGRKRSGSLDVGRADCGKGDYEVKGKNSNAFSKFLQRKMSKEKKENAKEEKEGSSPDMRKNSEAAEGAAAAEPAIPREAKVADAPSTPKGPVPTLNVVPALPEESEGPKDEEVAVTLRCGFQASGESRGSTYSRSSSASREQDPPPMVPEKTRIREKSPAHDIPRSNRPVPGMTSTPKEEPRAVEDKVVDGNISLEQINAILSAKESKKRLSREREGSLDGDAAKGLGGRRPSSISTTSVESDEPLPKTNFIDCDISSSSSGSLKDQARSRDSVGSGDHVRLSADLEAAAADAEATVTLRKPKLTVSLTAGPRVSLTQPEFTVVEEDVVTTSPETERQTQGTSPDDRRSESEMDDDEDDEEDEEAEQSDYFPVVGVEVRPPSPTNLKLPDSPTLGITRLKAFIGEMEKEDAKTSSVRTGISRLGHSAAVEKLKEEIVEDPRD